MKILKYVILLAFCLASFKSFAQTKPLVIGSKNFTEQAILGEIFAQWISYKTDIKVEKKLFLGGSQFAFESLKKGEIDIYPEYTGTGWISILKHKDHFDSQTTYQKTKDEFFNKYKLVWLKPLGFNNTYAFAVRPDDSRFQNIKNYSGLKSIDHELRFGAPHEFTERPDGYPKLQKAYDLKFKEFVGLDPGLMYTALIENQVDLITAFSTDGRIQKFNLKTLKDDQGFFPPYDVCPLVRLDALKRYPKLEAVLNELAGKISEKEMVEMNYQVDLNGKSAQNVARAFLVKKGFIQDSKTSRQSFWQSRGKTILKRTFEHIVLVLISLGFGILIALPLGILLSRKPRLKNITFAIISPLQTIPSLALLGIMIPLFGIGYVPAIIALFLYSLLPLVQNTYTGIQDIDPHLKDVANGMGLTPLQILKRIELPLALPTILAGLRIATVLNIGTATLAALIGAGGLGDLIFKGISSVNHNLILMGALPAALLALFVDKILQTIEKRLRVHLK